MRLLYKPLLISCCLAAFFSVMYISCKKTSSAIDKCKSVACHYGGACDSNSGKCICLPGYEGANCETVSRDKFLGSWNVSEKGSVTQATHYMISIQKSTQITDIVIENFYNYFFTPIKGYVTGDTLYILTQQYEGKQVLGTGYIYSDSVHGQFGTISMRYEVIDSATQLVNDFGYNATDLSNPSAWNK